MRFGDQTWTYRELVAEACRRAALLADRLEPGRPPHVGVLLDNVPDYLSWLTAAALSGSVIVGINSTYRGDQLGRLIRHTDCQLLVTAAAHEPLLAGVDTGVAPQQVLLVDSASYAEEIAAQPKAVPDVAVTEEALLLLIFTSGSTGLPKAVRCTQGRLARTGGHVASIAGLSAGDAIYARCRSFTPAPCSPAGHRPSTRASRSRRGRGSRRQGRCLTSAASAPPCSPTRARC